MSDIQDQSYIEYLRATGAWTKDQELLWAYLSNITELLSKIAENYPDVANKPDTMMGQYKIQPQSGGGMRKGPPPIII